MSSSKTWASNEAASALNSPAMFGNTRSDAIDGLRALAVLAVIGFHFDTGLAPSGFVGVDIFFAISGYVIALSLSKNIYTSTLQYIIEFYKRRIVRIMPALIVCLVTVGVLAELFIPQSWLSARNDETGLLAFFGLSNFALLIETDGYFNHRTNFNPFLHTWSLAVEEQFYLFFPILLLPWLRKSNSNSNSIHSLVLNNLVLIIGLSSLAWAVYETSASPQTAFFMLASRFWELAAGATLFQFHSTGRCIPKSAIGVRLLAVFGVAAIASSIAWADTEAFPFPWALPSILGTLALIATARSPNADKSFVIAILKQPLVVFIGRCSYSIYLWHWPIVVLMRWTIGFQTVSQIFTALVLTLFFGIASYQFIERPFSDSKPLRHLPAWLVVGIGVALTIGLAMGFNSFVGKNFSLSVVAKEVGWKNADLPSIVRPQPPRLNKHAPTLYVFGDSHAGFYIGMLREAAAQTGMKIRRLGKSGCRVSGLRYPDPNTSLCNEARRKAINHLSRYFSEGDVVFLASLRGQPISNNTGMLPPDELNQILNGDNSKEYRQALEQTSELVEKLLSMGFVVIIDTPKPVYRAPPFRCTDWFNRDNPICAPGFEVSAKELRDLDKPVLASLAQLKAKFPSIVIWDPFPILCPDITCSAYRNGKPLFFDLHHLSGHGNQLLLPSFVEQLKSITRENGT
jgi:peptidoglycan/LPS O-acetylase OafA/YrhL